MTRILKGVLGVSLFVVSLSAQAISFDESGLRGEYPDKMAGIEKGLALNTVQKIKAELEAELIIGTSPESAIKASMDEHGLVISKKRLEAIAAEMDRIITESSVALTTKAKVAADIGANQLSKPEDETPTNYLSKFDFLIGSASRVKTKLAESQIIAGNADLRVQLMASIPVSGEFDRELVKYYLFDNESGVLNFSINNMGDNDNRITDPGVCQIRAGRESMPEGCFWRYGVGLKALRMSGDSDVDEEFIPALYGVWGVQMMFGGRSAGSTINDSAFGIAPYIMATYVDDRDRMTEVLGVEPKEVTTSVNLDMHYTVDEKLKLVMGYAYNLDKKIGQRAFLSLKLTGE